MLLQTDKKEAMSEFFVRIRHSLMIHLCFLIQRGRSRADQKPARSRKALIEPLTNRDMFYICPTTTHFCEPQLGRYIIINRYF